ncbi:MAG: general secretion pathway protein GspE, partial [Sulfurimonas sp.]|nr:general secretion pathway protein GspE [Sulfurimonas sp.]
MLDRITSDLLANGFIMKGQVDRLVAKGLDSGLILRDITISGFMTMDRLIRFIVDKIQAGEYHISIIDNYDYIQEKDVLIKLAQKQNLAFLDLDAIDMDYRLTEKVSMVQLKKYIAFPITEDDLSVTIAFCDPLDIEAQEAIQRLFPRKPIKIAVATKKQIESYLFKVELKDSIKGLVKKIRDELNSISTVEEQQEASSILLLIDVILSACIKDRASDVHIEPTEKNCVVRTRIDGKLVEIFIFEKDIYPPLA